MFRLFKPLLAAAVLVTLPVSAHVGSCDERTGIEKARCERHQKMFDKCGILKGDEHFDCDRTFLLANLLNCSQQSGEDKAKCEKEVTAFKTCETQQKGRDFLGCVRKEAGSSPMGH